MSAGIVLTVAVHRGDDRKARRPNRRPQRRTLPRPAPVPEIAQRGIFAEECLDFRSGPVVARIVDREHLSKGLLRHLGIGFLDQPADIAFLVKRWNDNGNTHERGGPAKARRMRADGAISNQLSPRCTTL